MTDKLQTSVGIPVDPRPLSWERRMTLHDRQAYQLSSHDDLAKVLKRLRELEGSEFPEIRTKACVGAKQIRAEMRRRQRQGADNE